MNRAVLERRISHLEKLANEEYTQEFRNIEYVVDNMVEEIEDDLLPNAEMHGDPTILKQAELVYKAANKLQSMLNKARENM